MGSNGPTPLTTVPVKTTGEAITFFQLLRTGARLRNFEWWINIVFDVFASDAAAAASLARAIRIDDLTTCRVRPPKVSAALPSASMSSAACAHLAHN